MTAEGESQSYTQTAQGTVTFDYNITEDTYVYIYASEPANQPSFLNKTRAAEDFVKIYSICISPETITGIHSAPAENMNPIQEYISIDGVRSSKPTTPGIYIIRRRDGSTSKIVIR